MSARVSENDRKQVAYVFIDEAGDFNFSPTGSRYYHFTAISGTRPFPLDGPLAELRFDLIEQGHDIEYFHACDDRQVVRDAVFSVIQGGLKHYRVDTVVVQKARTNPVIRPPEVFYPRMLGYLVQYVIGGLDLSKVKEVIVITDTIPVQRKRHIIKGAIKPQLAKMLPATAKYRLLHQASKSCCGLQIVDYVNWAIQRKWNRHDYRSYNLIKGDIFSEFDIFRKGDHDYY